MAFAAYRRKRDGKVFYAFEEDAWSRLPKHQPEGTVAPTSLNWHVGAQYEKLPPNPVVVTATSVYMTDEPQLDSLKTIYELDRRLNIEARDEKEAEAHQEARREI